MAIDLILKQVNDIKSMWEELIKDASAQQHRGAVLFRRKAKYVVLLVTCVSQWTIKMTIQRPAWRCNGDGDMEGDGDNGDNGDRDDSIK